MATARLSIATRLGRMLRALAALLGGAGVIVIGLQSIWWFEDGYWSPKSPLDLWLWFGNAYTPIRGGGIDRIILWLIDLPLGAVLLTAALFVFWAGQRLTRSIATS